MIVGVNQKICPIRYMFLVQPDNEERFKRAMQTAGLLWGGMYSPIFPVYQEIPEDFRREYQINITTATFYNNTISNYDPDIIFYDEDLEIGYLKTLAGEHELTPINEFISKISTLHYDDCITVMEICSYILDESFKYQRTDNLHIRIPEFTDDDLFLHALCGSILPDFENFFITQLKDHPAYERPALDWTTLNDYRKSDRIDIQVLSNHGLRSWSTGRMSRNNECVYFLDSTRLRDVMNFWNLRAAGWNIMPVAVNQHENLYFSERFDFFLQSLIGRHGGNAMMLCFLTPSVYTEESIESAVQGLSFDKTKYHIPIITSFQKWFPRFWEEYDLRQADHIQSHQPFYEVEFAHYQTNEKILEIPVGELPFESEHNVFRSRAFKLLLELSPENKELEYAEVLTGINNSQLRSLVGFFSMDDIRLSATGIHGFARSGTDKVTMTMPLAIDFFRHYFSNLGHRLQVTPNSKLAREVFRNMGGLTGAKRFLRSARLKIIESFEGGKVVTFDGLVGHIKKLTKINQNDMVKAFISMLLEHKIIEMGAQIQCKVCDQHGFYLPDHLKAELTCPVCRNTFELPRSSPGDIVWAYRGIGPFSRNNKADGVMAVFATLALLRDEFADQRGHMSALFGFELSPIANKDDKKEVDLGVLIRNVYDTERPVELMLCECKTYKRFEKVDVERLKLLGDAFPGAVLVVATLNESLDKEETGLIASLVKYLQKGTGKRPQNLVLILTGKELLPEDFRGAFKHYKEQIHSYHRYNDFIDALSDLTIKTHLQISTWSELSHQAHVTEMERRENIGILVGCIMRHIEGNAVEMEQAVNPSVGNSDSQA